MSARHQLLSHVKYFCVFMLHFAFNPSEDSFTRSAGVATIAAILSQTLHLFRDDASSVSSAAGKLSKVSNLASQHLGLMLHDGIVAVGGDDAIGKMLHSALGAASTVAPAFTRHLAYVNDGGVMLWKCDSPEALVAFLPTAQSCTYVLSTACSFSKLSFDAASGRIPVAFDFCIPSLASLLCCCHPAAGFVCADAPSQAASPSCSSSK
jgi:hypothetical protein